MQRTYSDPLVLSCLLPLDHNATTSLYQALLLNNETLDSIQKSLEEYLETKRMAFPRFYFLSNDELLEILSQTRDSHAVQKHMSKCFDAIKYIKFNDVLPNGSSNKKGYDDIIGFLDSGGEYVKLYDTVKAEGLVENWLKLFESYMRESLHRLCEDAFNKYPPVNQISSVTNCDNSIYRDKWLWSYPAQVVLAIDQVLWTMTITGILLQTSNLFENMTEFLTYSLQQIDAMVELIRLPLDKQQRTLLGALLTLDVHNRDVTRTLVSKGVSIITDFEWTKQLRYYWDFELNDLVMRQTNTFFKYGYEYLGNGPRLVVTPLTDTCYMTLTGALNMSLGGAPAGNN